ncbi:MAG: ribosome maturation factor RimM [Selenomonadaceae bacterium]|nr:ribosome maturation factor RimM [Selenomonadaceae bacterium]
MIKSSPSGAKGKSRHLPPKGRITIGRVGALQGIHGEIRVVPLTDFTERFDGLQEVMVGDELLHVESVRYHKQFVLMKFREYPVREDARQLTGRLLTVDRSEAAPLGEGEYYTFDIIGLKVFNPAGTELGVVENVLRTGANDVYQTRGVDGREILIPALKAVVKVIDVPGGRMVVELPDVLEDSAEGTAAQEAQDDAD